MLTIKGILIFQSKLAISFAHSFTIYFVLATTCSLSLVNELQWDMTYEIKSQKYVINLFFYYYFMHVITLSVHGLVYLFSKGLNIGNASSCPVAFFLNKDWWARTWPVIWGPTWARFDSKKLLQWLYIFIRIESCCTCLNLILIMETKQNKTNPWKYLQWYQNDIHVPLEALLGELSYPLSLKFRGHYPLSLTPQTGPIL